MRSRRIALIIILCLAALAVSTWPRDAAAQVTPEQVKASIGKGVNFLRGSGIFKRKAPQGTGMNALAVLAMLHCGVPPDDPDVVSGANLCANPANWMETTYNIGATAAALSAVDGKKYRATIEKCANWLIAAQNKDGGWRYQSRGKHNEQARKAWEARVRANPNLRRQEPGWLVRGNQESDHSCTQFAALGLRAADDAGVLVPDSTWKAVEKYLVDTQGKDGGWGYTNPGSTYGSMTAAGLGSLYICGMKLHQRAKKCGEYEENKRIAAGLDWLGRNFSVKQNPRRGNAHVGYYMYALERCCAFSGRKNIGGHDWYAEGAAHLVRTQQGNGSWQGGMGSPDTVFNLLFLGKASSMVLVQKLDYGPEWNTDYYDTENLVQQVSRELDLKCTRQTVTLADPVEGWLEAPILYITGHGKFVLTAAQRDKVREFCERGGTVVADACCMNRTFDESFRSEMAEIFPTVPLAEVPAEHYVYQAPHKITEVRNLVWEGITTGCRTVVFYSRKDLSCAWDGNIHDRALSVDERNAFRIGVNVAAYAMGYKPLKDKLDEVEPAVADGGAEDDGRVARGALVFAQLKHKGDWDPDPAATRGMLKSFSESTGARVSLKRVDIDPTDPELYKYPLIYMTGHEEFTYTDEQAKTLAEYFERGGFMLADACCGREKFDKAFRTLVKQVFPRQDLEPLPPEHRIFNIKYAINSVNYRPILKNELPEADKGRPRLEAVVVGGRAVLVYSPYDFGCAFEGFPCAACRGLEPDSAEKLVTNILLYGMTE